MHILYDDRVLEGRMKTGSSGKVFKAATRFWWDQGHSRKEISGKTFQYERKITSQWGKATSSVFPSVAGSQRLESPEQRLLGYKAQLSVQKLQGQRWGSYLLSSSSMNFRNLRQSFCRWEFLGQTFSWKTPSNDDIQRSGDALAMCYNAKVSNTDAKGAWLKEEDSIPGE